MVVSTLRSMKRHVGQNIVTSLWDPTAGKLHEVKAKEVVFYANELNAISYFLFSQVQGTNFLLRF